MNLKRMKTLASAGRMNRRELIQLAIAAGLTAATAESLFTAATAAPKSGGRFRLALGSGSITDTLDPATISDTYNQVVSYASLRSGLTEIDASGSAIADLAESFESSPDAKTWIFRLRKGAEFHNGKSVATDDVIASFNHHRGDESTSAAKSLLASVQDIKADGPDAVVFTLSGGDADFPHVVADFHIPIMPAKDGKADWQSGVGTGPYVLDRFEPGVRTTGKRYANYHRETYFDEIEVLSVADVAARMNALVTGEVDFIDRVDLKTVALLRREPRLDISEVNGWAHYVAPMNTTVAPFDDNNVRLALKYAVNREEIVQKVLQGHGTVANDSPIAPGVPFYADPKTKHTYDPDKAKFYLKQAGLDSLKVDLSAADAAFPGAVDTAVLMQEHAAACGIDINVIREANDGYWEKVWMNKPWCLSYWNGRPTPDLLLTTAYAADAAWNDTYWKHGRFNELLIAARAELDQKKRGDMYAEMQEILAEEGGTIVLMFYNYVNAHSTGLAHPEAVAPNYDVDGLKITQRWWFA